jgi:Asp-tRNA(Asn)/Glu-tRNA(Gln) amidotransferase A subunit family amidase
VGPLARSTAGLALAYNAMRGPDPLDPVCREDATEALTVKKGNNRDELRVAVAGGYFHEFCEDQALSVLDKAAADLNATRTVDIPDAAQVNTCTDGWESDRTNLAPSL